MRWGSAAAEENGQVLVELPLEVPGQHRSQPPRWRGGCGGQRGAELLEVKTDETERGLRIEDGQQEISASFRRYRRQKQLTPLPSVVQLTKWRPLELATQLGGRGVDRRSQGARRHDVDRARESVLGHHLPAGVQAHR